MSSVRDLERGGERQTDPDPNTYQVILLQAQPPPLHTAAGTRSRSRLDLITLADCGNDNNTVTTPVAGAAVLIEPRA